MYIPNDDTQNYPFFRLQFVVEMFGHLTYWSTIQKVSLFETTAVVISKNCGSLNHNLKLKIQLNLRFKAVKSCLFIYWLKNNK